MSTEKYSEAFILNFVECFEVCILVAYRDGEAIFKNGSDKEFVEFGGQKR
jgi:hypothetical protein